MNIYNVIVILIIFYILYKNVNITYSDIIVLLIISQILYGIYIKHNRDIGNKKNEMYDQFDIDRKIYNYSIFQTEHNNQIQDKIKDLKHIFNL